MSIVTIWSVFPNPVTYYDNTNKWIAVTKINKSVSKETFVESFKGCSQTFEGYKLTFVYALIISSHLKQLYISNKTERFSYKGGCGICVSKEELTWL